ncbi:uncharacterized protein PHACADRAFT_212767, partial [Phanerochaete carnosa HHB-10118-sp]
MRRFGYPTLRRRGFARISTRSGLTACDFLPRRRTDSRSYVYSFTHYSAKNRWGPFIQDGSGRVNWEHVLAVHHVMSMQIVPQPQVEHQDPYMIFPMSLPFTQSILPVDLDLNATEDWAGIEGVWQCAFSFIDHRELLVFNNLSGRHFDDELRTALFESPDFVEIFSRLDVMLKLIRTEPDPEHPTRPILHFTCESRTGTTMVGYVCVTPDDNIRWHFESGQNGDNVWSSEGVQVGNVRSPFGVLGTWTTTTHDVGDPVGMSSVLHH